MDIFNFKTTASNKKITLYHASKSGLKGKIAPVSSPFCDFGKAFYMGTAPSECMKLIIDCENPKLYTLSLNLSGLKILDFDLDMSWVMLIAHNKGKTKAFKASFKASPIYKKYSSLAKSCAAGEIDIITGCTANDNMFLPLDLFFTGLITDTALLNALSALSALTDLKTDGQYTQHAALTEKACQNITVTNEQTINPKQLEALKEKALQNRQKSVDTAEEIRLKYRREGRYFDEIMKDGE